ncbi:Rab3 GTPase-activating protein catalytic subunit [Mortierella sp. NVP41]|nr:Rab3 GTPase-activating protein catalytic subunit [Mortierella sp. NVP41]
MAEMEADDFENFEFIDYTTSGPWEKFIIQIESCLKQWGLVHNSYGVFNPNRMPATDENMDLDQELALALHEDHQTSPTNASPKPPPPNATVNGSDPSQDSSLSKVYQHNATLTFKDVSYILSYRYHPAKARIASGVERIDLEFLPTTLEGSEYHSLHRWTALTHLLVLSPAPDYASHIFDLGNAKLILSSFAIAFQNIGCNIPVFVPTGQVRNGTYMGLSIRPQLLSARDPDLGLEEVAEDQALEVRFNTVLVPYPPAQYTDLAGILELFVTRMGIDDDYADMSDGSDGDEGYSQQLKEQIIVSALFSYELDNWYDEDWRRWADKGEGTVAHTRERLPDLPFGPVQDPLKSLQLVARFASAPITVYLDSKNLTEMDASQANIWIVKAVFKPDDYGLLSGILEDAVASWSMEVTSHLGSSSKGQTEEKDQGSYTSLLRRGARLIQGTIAMVDASDVENIIDDLCSGSPPPAQSASDTTNNNNITASQPTFRRHTHPQGGTGRVVTAAELGLHFRRATTVPYNSFLWKMLRHLVDVISPNSHISYPTSFMGFTKAVWADLLMQFNGYWERKELIPLIDVFGDITDGPPNDDGDNSGSTKSPFIDLRFNLLHQKLSMVNCCIARELVLRQDEQRSSSSTPSSPLSIDNTSERPTSDEPKAQAETEQGSLSSSTENGDDSPKSADADDSLPSNSSSNSSSTDDKQEVLIESLNAVDLNASPASLELTTSTPPTDTTDAPSVHRSEGALRPYKDLKLLETGAPLMIPKLQDQGHMTEDMIQDQEELFEGLGSSADAAKTRAELQSSQLISDMGAFKAANPGCTIGDFVRWHSPKDWDEKKGHMSARMADSGNFWQELWEKAEALPASKQKPLFNHQCEAEKALSYLKGLSGSQIFVQLLPTICLLAYDALVSHPVSTVSEQVATALQELAQALTDFPWDELSVTEKSLDLKPVFTKFKQAEQTVGRVVSLVRKFPEQFSLVERILKDSESVVEDGTERDCVFNLFSAGGFTKTVFPKPMCREFVMETFDPVSTSPSSSFMVAPQGPTFVTPDDVTGWDARSLQRRMYVCFKNSEVRIVEAIAKDGMFL